MDYSRSWSLGPADATHSLLYGRDEVYRAPRAVARNIATTASTVPASPPYAYAQLVTVVLSGKGDAALFVDGTQHSNEPTEGELAPVTLPDPRFVARAEVNDEQHGVFAPLVFSCVLDGDTPPPVEVTVEMYQGAAGAGDAGLVRLESASLKPSGADGDQ